MRDPADRADVQLSVHVATPRRHYTACDAGLHIAHPDETCTEHEADTAALRVAWNRMFADAGFPAAGVEGCDA